jgi:hypothetical protein
MSAHTAPFGRCVATIFGRVNAIIFRRASVRWRTSRLAFTDSHRSCDQVESEGSRALPVSRWAVPSDVTVKLMMGAVGGMAFDNWPAPSVVSSAAGGLIASPMPERPADQFR